MVDVTANATWAWQSSPLTLISATIPLPEIKNIEAYSNTGYTKLNIGFTYDLKNTEDIEFMKHNLITTISLYSAEDLLLIEELMVTNEMITGNEVEAFFLGEYRNFMLIKIRMATHAGTILKTVDKTYSPYEQSKVLYTVVNGEVKKIGTVYQKGVAYFPDQIIDIKTSVVLPPIITKDTEIPYLFHIERQDTEGALPNHYVDVYINDTLFLTTQEEDLDLTQYLQQYEHSVMITMKFISKRTLSGYTWYCDTPVILQGFNLVVGPDLICDFTTII
jgi:hypothetical protein